MAPPWRHFAASGWRPQRSSRSRSRTLVASGRAWRAARAPGRDLAPVPRHGAGSTVSVQQAVGLLGSRVRVCGGRWQVAGGRWQGAGGRWQVAGGRWQVAGGRGQARAPPRPLLGLDEARALLSGPDRQAGARPGAEYAGGLLGAANGRVGGCVPCRLLCVSRRGPHLAPRRRAAAAAREA